MDPELETLFRNQVARVKSRLRGWERKKELERQDRRRDVLTTPLSEFESRGGFRVMPAPTLSQLDGDPS